MCREELCVDIIARAFFDASPPDSRFSLGTHIFTTLPGSPYEEKPWKLQLVRKVRGQELTRRLPPTILLWYRFGTKYSYPSHPARLRIVLIRRNSAMSSRRAAGAGAGRKRAGRGDSATWPSRRLTR